VDDYAYFIQCLIDLYEASLRQYVVDRAIELQEKQDALFWDTTVAGISARPAMIRPSWYA